MDSRTVQRLAGEFNRLLRDAIGGDNFDAVCQLNAKETDPNVCHSHDFCDANEVMLAAYQATVGPMDLQSDTHRALWNAAWATAKALQDESFVKGENDSERDPLWRVQTTAPGSREPFVDWYNAATEAEALELAGEDAHRYCLPAGTTFAARLATDEERACIAR